MLTRLEQRWHLWVGLCGCYFLPAPPHKSSFSAKRVVQSICVKNTPSCLNGYFVSSMIFFAVRWIVPWILRSHFEGPYSIHDKFSDRNLVESVLILLVFLELYFHLLALYISLLHRAGPYDQKKKKKNHNLTKQKQFKLIYHPTKVNWQKHSERSRNFKTTSFH